MRNGAENQNNRRFNVSYTLRKQPHSRNTEEVRMYEYIQLRCPRKKTVISTRVSDQMSLMKEPR